MITVKSTIKLNGPAIKKLESAQLTALAQTAEALHTEIVQAQVVPRKDGTLQGEGFYVDLSDLSSGKATLVHNTPYARRLYFHPEYNFHTGPWEETVNGNVHRHEGNPHARGEWFEDWLPGGSKADFAVKTYREIYRRLAGL